ncbi:hypothetical protein Ciccas_006455, partial [Cichlidogyrus casuarinus]
FLVVGSSGNQLSALPGLLNNKKKPVSPRRKLSESLTPETSRPVTMRRQKTLSNLEDVMEGGQSRSFTPSSSVAISRLDHTPES